jgi:hypothetical protein
MRSFWYAATLVAALIPAAKAQAEMGLLCSQWLDARAYIRFDARTKQFRDERPRTVPPVSEDVDTKMGWANWYLSGYVMTKFKLNTHLAKVGAAVGVTVTPADPKEDLLREFTAIDNLCRNGLQKERRDYDVAELIDLRADGVLALRMLDVTTMIENGTEAGRRLGARKQ